jgi:hypothetical protein
MENNMNEFDMRQHMRLELETVRQGVLFLFRHFDGEGGDVHQVEQSWSNVHTMLARLRKNRRYCAKNVPLLVWKEGEALHVKYFLPDIKVAEECVFSVEETSRILTELEKLPSLN